MTLDGRAARAGLAVVMACLIGPAATAVAAAPPAWTSGLDMHGMEVEIGARLDAAVAQHKIAPDQAAELKARLAKLKADSDAGYASRNFPPAEWSRITAALNALSGEVPDVYVPPEPPKPAWAASLGMKDLEDEIGARADDAVGRGKLSAQRAVAIKAQVKDLRAERQARQEARDFSLIEYRRVEGELVKLADSLPDLPPTHPPATAPTADWSEAHASAPLDLSGYRMTFDDEFNRLDIAPDGGKAKWYAPVHSDFGSAHFLAPGPTGPFGLEKTGLGLGGSALSITARKTPSGWTSGLIQTVDSHGKGFAQQYGYFEMRAKLPRGKATWPAFWLLTQNGYSDPTATRGEIDVLEQYGSSPERIHSSVHLWPAEARNAGGLPEHWYKSHKAWVGDMSSAYHRYGVMMTPDWVITYFDGAETARFPAPEQYRTPVYILVNLTMHKKDLAQATDPSVMLVDYVRAYAKT